jgi:hypothetical protein
MTARRKTTERRWRLTGISCFHGLVEKITTMGLLSHF